MVAQHFLDAAETRKKYSIELTSTSLDTLFIVTKLKVFAITVNPLLSSPSQLSSPFSEGESY